MAKIVHSRDRLNIGSSRGPGMYAPATVAARTPTAPSSDASTTFPLRNRYMYQPTSNAIGIVQAIVNVPHELPRTSRVVFVGRKSPGPVLSAVRFWSFGTASSNDSWNVIDWPGAKRYSVPGG